MNGCNGGRVYINSFALVSYLPDPIASFLDRLRRELVPQCHAKAHVTVLPPRPLTGPPEDAWNELMEGLKDFSPFRLELSDVRIFPVTQVIYVSVGMGYRELERMHAALNKSRVAFDEPFDYHAHVTLAQELGPEDVAPALDIANRRWRESGLPRDFMIDKLTFVQNTLENSWQDLAECSLSSHSNISI